MKIITYIIVLAGLVLTSQGKLSGQRLAVPKNVDITIHQNRAIIHYDIKVRKPGSTHLVDLKFLDEDFNLVTPALITGDIGPHIPGGPDRIIEWDITNDIQNLGSDLAPVLFIDGKSKQFSNTGGPGNAFLSLLLPGLGDYFVADRRMITIKPYIRTLSSLGLIGLGAYLGNQRYQAEGEYRLVLKADYYRYEGMDRYWLRYFEGEMQYAWFRGDKEVFISLGAAFWAADIIWVLAKGSNNVRFMKATIKGSDFHLGYVPGGAALQFSYTF
ncbi:MAG: hypothetical protein V2B15_13765 [Bacteroidota bacterium]